MYCEIDVTNFSRHLFRHHGDEKEVLEILSLKANDPRRKLGIQNIRKRGNFVISRAVRNTPGNVTDSELLPCKFCKGYYIKSSLRFHVKTCVMNVKGEKCRAQAEGQTLKAGYFCKDDMLAKEAFPKMRGDDISLVIK